MTHMAETGYQSVPHDAAFRDALLATPGVQEAFDALGEEYTTLDALWAKEADDRLDAYKRGELKAVALAAVAAKYPNLLTPAVGASN